MLLGYMPWEVSTGEPERQLLAFLKGSMVKCGEDKGEEDCITR
jgi:hypothetical protein